jgi:hypothetical protein
MVDEENFDGSKFVNGVMPRIWMCGKMSKL